MAAISQRAAWFRITWTPWRITVALVIGVAVVGILPGVKMSLVVNGLFLAAIIALGAIGLTLIFGILKFRQCRARRLHDDGRVCYVLHRRECIGTAGTGGRGTRAIHVWIPTADRSADRYCNCSWRRNPPGHRHLSAATQSRSECGDAVNGVARGGLSRSVGWRRSCGQPTRRPFQESRGRSSVCRWMFAFLRTACSSA